ncbi:hypothetical protein LXA43DRAFT_1100846 [Ganoderma leucocontextum]|nr:hypothetical protein LXA43DRAFT_1100846 [Ganoderma leucocontextum]
MALVLFAASILPVASAATITLDATTITECVQSTLTWTGGSPPFKLKIWLFKADNNDTTLAQQYQNLSIPSLPWTANFTAGTRLQFDITDADGDSNGDPPVTVLAGSDTSCLGSASASSSGSPTATGSGGVSASTASGSSSPNPAPLTLSRTGLSAGAIAGIAVGVGVIAVIVTALTVWCLLKRLLLKHRRHSGIPTPSPSSSSTQVRADEVRMSWYKRAARRMSLRGREFDIDRPAASPTFSDAPTVVAQRRPLLPVLSYNGISSTLARTAPDPYRPPSQTDSVIVSGPSSPASDRGEVSFRQTSYAAPSLPQQSTTSLSDAQSHGRKAKRPAHAHNTSDSSNRSGGTTTSSTELRMARTTSPVLSTSLSHSSGDRESRRDRDTSTLASTISTLRTPRTPRSPRHETDGGIRLLGGPTGLEAEGEGGNVGVVVPGDGEGTVTVVSGSPPPYSA